MKFRANKMLGLAVGERSILVAEVATTSGTCQFNRAGVFAYPDGVTVQQPEAVGAALALFLKEQGFSARAAVFGIPAKWVLTKAKELPPVDPTLAADMLRMQVESEFSAELKDLIYDYVGRSEQNAASHVLLAATPKRHIEQIDAIAKAARLDAQGIAPTSVVLGLATTSGVTDALVLSITPSGTELAAQRGPSPSLLRHVSSGAGVTATVAGEVRRASLMMPRNGTSNGNGASNGHVHGQIVVWDDASGDITARRAVTDALGPSARNGDFSLLGAGDAPAGISLCSAAVALAVAGVSEAGLPVDFLHSRLAPPKKPPIQRTTALAIAAGIAIVAAVIFAYVDLHNKAGELEHKQFMLKQSEGPRKAAADEVARIKYAKGWHAESPRYLACLRDLTIAIPDDGRMYLTSFNLHDNMKGDIAGTLTQGNEKNVLALADRLKALNQGKRFKEVDPSVDKRQARHGQEISFSIRFRYAPAE